MAEETAVQAIIVMGVAGAGKTTVGHALASALGWPFYDGDDFHSLENIARMTAGIPLTDADRAPWLAAMNALLVEHALAGQPLVLACSALRRRYRDALCHDATGTRFVYLKADEATLKERLRERAGHYMKAAMLESQLAALEEPEDALTVDAALPVEQAVAVIINGLGVSGSTESRASKR